MGERKNIVVKVAKSYKGPLLVREDHSDNQKTQRLIRGAADRLAKEIPHHDYSKFSSEIDLDGITLLPLYLLRFQTLYDNRRVFNQSIPYTGQSIQKRIYFKTSDVNVWDFSLMKSDAFKNRKETYNINGSHHIETCGNCGGDGSITCPDCQGSGRNHCSTCSGSGQTNCSSCNGSGRTFCYTCSGNGSYMKGVDVVEYVNGQSVYTTKQLRVSCSSCGGSGYHRCSTCNSNGKVTCSRCGGSGYITCSKCRGNGHITCPVCNGHGRMLHFISLTQELRPDPLNKCIVEKQLDENFPNFYIDPAAVSAELLKTDNGPGLPAEFLDETHLGKIYRSQLNTTVNEHPFRSADGATRIMHQQCDFLRVDVYEITYRFRSKEYKMLMWKDGKTYRLYAPVSPFSELKDKFLRDTAELMGRRRWGRAMNCLEKASDLDFYKEDGLVPQYRQEIIGKMDRQYRWALFLGSLISSAALIWFSIHFYQKSRFILPWFKVLFEDSDMFRLLHPYVIGGLQLLIVLVSQKRFFRFLKKYWGHGIRHEWVRWFFPAVLASVQSGLIWCSLFILNAVGLTALVTGVVILLILGGVLLYDRLFQQ